MPSLSQDATSPPMHISTLSRLDAWALSLGCILGWGAYVMPGTTFLPMAGPAGTAMAMGLGCLLLLCIAINFAYMMERRPEGCGSAYSYTRLVLGQDFAFLCAWAIGMAYLSLIWANATAFTLIARHLCGSVVQWGPQYSILGYDVYFGEGLVSLTILVLFGLISAFGGRLVPRLQTVLVIVLLLAVTGCFSISFAKAGWQFSAFAPAFATGRPPVAQVLGIIGLIPWAFVGFESIAHSAGDFRFPVKKSLPIMVLAICTGAVVYIALTCLATLAVPDCFANWQEYVDSLDHLNGTTGLATFNAAQNAMGDSGLILLGIAMLATLATSLLGFYRATARLISTLAKDGLLPQRLAVWQADGTPRAAVFAVMVLSAAVPFLGRITIAWITDISTICVSIAYLLTSACCWVLAQNNKQRHIMFTGAMGVCIAALAFIIPLVPNLWNSNTLTTESYLMLAAWSCSGLIAYHLAMWQGRQRHLGQSPLIWIVMLFLLFFAMGMWAKNVVYDAIDTANKEITHIHSIGLGVDKPKIPETNQ